MSIKTHEFIFESSGVKVTFRTVNPLVAIDVRKSMMSSEPKPPEEEVELAGKKTMLANEDDPEYVELHALWEEEVNRKVNESYTQRAKFKFDDADWRQEVADYRASIGIKLDESDEWIYITRIISTPDELQAFYAKVTGSTSPSPEAVQVARDSFRPEIPTA